jgi:hypothetical protein
VRKSSFSQNYFNGILMADIFEKCYSFSPLLPSTQSMYNYQRLATDFPVTSATTPNFIHILRTAATSTVHPHLLNDCSIETENGSTLRTVFSPAPFLLILYIAYVDGTDRQLIHEFGKMHA